MRLTGSKAGSAARPVPVKKMTCIGNSPLSRLTRKGNRRKRYRGQGK